MSLFVSRMSPVSIGTYYDYGDPDDPAQLMYQPLFLTAAGGAGLMYLDFETITASSPYGFSSQRVVVGVTGYSITADTGARDKLLVHAELNEPSQVIALHNGKSFVYFNRASNLLA